MQIADAIRAAVAKAAVMDNTNWSADVMPQACGKSATMN